MRVALWNTLDGMTMTEEEPQVERLRIEALLLLYLLFGPDDDGVRQDMEMLRGHHQLVGPWIDAA